MTADEAVSPRQSWRTARIVLVAFAGVLALACAVVGVGVTIAPKIVPSSWTAPQASVDREADVVSAARDATTALFSTDYRTIDESNKKILSMSTGRFKTQFAASQVEVAAAFRAEQVVRTVSILQVGVGRLTETSAVVSVAADTELSGIVTQKGKNGASVKKPVKGNAPYRWELTMQKVGDSWLLENLEFVV